eukprot:SAG22_NODE_15207_length_354_cov_0.988235_1_plen_49_part_10
MYGKRERERERERAPTALPYWQVGVAIHLAAALAPPPRAQTHRPCTTAQ